MKSNMLPFNISFVRDVDNTFAGLLPVQSLQLFEGKSGDFNPQGLYSNIIFGRKGDKTRETKESYINLKVPIFHPLYFKELVALKQLYMDILTRQGYATWDPELKDFVRSDVMTGETGFAFFVKHFGEMEFQRNKSQQRDLRIDLLEKYKSQAFIKRLFVIPAGIRDIEITEEGQPKEEDINPLYRRVISVANTINVDFEQRNSELLDEAKSNLQKAVVNIYDYIFNMLEGKKGLLQGKLASRKVIGSTRNVLSSMEVGSTYLGDERQPGLNTTIIGLFQYVKGTEAYYTEYAFRKLFLSDLFDEYEVPRLIDRETLKSKEVTLSDKAREKWLTSEGLEGIINGFADATLRHNPVTIDGMYLRLIYNDGKSYRIMKDINELPDGFDAVNVSPMTWAEMFYLLGKEFIKRNRAFVTRYPVTGLGSIYASEVYVKTTVSGLLLEELDGDFQPTGNKALEFPDTRNKLAFFDTMAVSPYMLKPLGADFDGDVISCTLVNSDEGVAEVTERLKSKSAYLSPTGGLTYNITTDVSDLVLNFMTGD